MARWHGQVGVRQAGVAGQAGGDTLAHGGHPFGQGRGEGGVGEQVEGVLLGELGEQAAELLQRRGPPRAPVGVATRGCSRSSTGASLRAALSGWNQNAWPGPSRTTTPVP